MSVNEPPSPFTDDDTNNSQRAPHPPFASELAALDRRLKHLSEQVLPLHPFLLALPTNAPFRLGGRLSENWAIGHDRPFRPEEQQLQYMTFLTHQDADSLLVAVGDWSDETGSIMADRSSAQTTTDNPKDGVARKKISLKDYKNQKTSGTAASPAGQISGDASVADPGEMQPAIHVDVVKHDNPIASHQKPSKPPAHHSADRGSQKRPSETRAGHTQAQRSNNSEVHSPKKPRLSPEKEARRDATPSTSHSPGLPTLLSPTLPPTSGGPKLPRLLSPTLPPDIEKELAQLGDRPPVRDHSPKPEPITSAKPKLDDISKSGGSSSHHTLHRKYPSPHEHSKDNHLLDTKARARVATSKPQRVVKLRYGKSNRKRVEALLKFSGKRKTHSLESPRGQDTDRDDDLQDRKKRKGEDVTSTSARGNISSSRAKGKTKHETDETINALDDHAKERKASTEKPRTPASHPSLSSSVSSAHDKAKSSSITPLKDPKVSVSRRNDPSESGTKVSPTQPDRSNERRVWRDEYQKFGAIGRELKHAADRHSTRQDATATDEKLAAVTAVEAIMCFILAFVADDQSKSLARQVGDSSAWQSILPYWRVVKNKSAPYPALYSLSVLLGAISYDAIHSLDLERLAIIPLPGEHTPVPTPGSDGNTVLSDETKKSRKEFIELKNQLPKFHKESQKLWLEGTRGLSEDVLAREFPKTWSGRSRNYSERGRPQLKAGDYSGAYFLPLGSTTSPIEVVRFAWALLKEWCAKEGVDWTGRLDL
ncbi:uncharacterized protein PFLUO_LOCUS6544 [Penicillium psychrofluorescens]|uniref:uncharacterized protein n=1 Tax=Penicillium psychrofluorescens TaxID=3158075 RepID=UPI003CCDCAB7